MTSTSKIISYAPTAWEYLHGFICLHKPANMGSKGLLKRVKYCLSNDLNSMEVRPPRNFIKIEGSVGDEALTVTSVPSLADHPKVVGPRYLVEDVRFRVVDSPGYFSSGVTVGAIRTNENLTDAFVAARHMAQYEVHIEFGKMSDNLRFDGRIVDKSKFGHVTLERLERVLGAIQASHQSNAFKYCGVASNSQEAFELASRGLVRPNVPTPPIIYSIRPKKFQLPYCILELQCVNPNEVVFMQMVHDIGLKVRSCALTHAICRTRLGQLDSGHALLRQHWHLQHVLDNIRLCAPLFKQQQPTYERPTLLQSTAIRTS